jgi:hypothetical protein
VNSNYIIELWFNLAVFKEFINITISGRYRDVYLLSGFNKKRPQVALGPHAFKHLLFLLL